MQKAVVEGVTKTIDATADITTATGVAATVGIGLKCTGKAIAYLGKVVFASIDWSIAKDSTPDTRVKEHAHCDLVGFDFDKFAEPKLKAEMYDMYEFPFLQLFKYLWGGNWRCQLRLMNESIQDYNRLNMTVLVQYWH